MQIKPHIAGKAAVTPDQQAEQKAELQSSIQQLRQHIDKLENYKAHSEFISMADNDKIKQLQARAAMQVEMLEGLLHSLETGLPYDPNNPQVDFTEMEEYITQQLGTGFHDNNGELQFFDEKLAIEGYEGTIMLENSGMHDPMNPAASNALFFVLEPNDKEVIAKTVGNDIHLLITNTNEEDRIVVLDQMATRPEAIYIHAGQANQAVNINLSQATRMGDGNWIDDFGTQRGFIVGGSKHNDTIIGSSGTDVIWGDIGDDTIYGLGGIDEIYGDAYNQIGAAGFTSLDGNDTIDGGAGDGDIIRAGGGNQDKVYNAQNDYADEDEFKGMRDDYDTPDPESLDWLQQSTGWTGEYAPDGTLVINPQSDGQVGELNIWLGEDYDMLTAEVDSTGSGVIFTMAGFNDAGVPREMRIRVNDFFNQSFTLNVLGNNGHNIIDMNAISLYGQHAVIQGGEGDDIILAPKSEFDDLGIPAEKFGENSVPLSELESIIQQGTRVHQNKQGEDYAVMTWGMQGHPETGSDVYWEQYNNEHYSFIQDGEIVLSIGEEIKEADLPSSLNFDMPAGYQHAYLTNDPNIVGNGGDYKLIFITHNPDGEIVQAVVRLKGLPSDLEVSVDGVPVKLVSQMPVSVHGGKGEDTVFGSSSSMHVGQSTNHAITGHYESVERGIAEPMIALGTQIANAEIDQQTAEAAEADAISAYDDAKSLIMDQLETITSKQNTDGTEMSDSEWQDLIDTLYNELIDTAAANPGFTAMSDWLGNENNPGMLEELMGDKIKDNLTFAQLASIMVDFVRAQNKLSLAKSELGVIEYKLKILHQKAKGKHADEPAEDEESN